MPAAIAALAVLAIAGAAVIVTVWSGATLLTDPSALAKVTLDPLAGTLVRAAAFAPDGQAIPLHRAGGRLTPLVAVPAGELISVDVVIRRPGWLSWALGSYRDERLTVRAPVAQSVDTSLTVAPGAAVRISFDHAVSALAYSADGQPPVRLALAGPARTVTLPGLGGAGTAEVSAAVRPWEKLGAPFELTWLPPSHSPVLLASPAPGSNLSPARPGHADLLGAGVDAAGLRAADAFARHPGLLARNRQPHARVHPGRPRRAARQPAARDAAGAPWPSRRPPARSRAPSEELVVERAARIDAAPAAAARPARLPAARLAADGRRRRRAPRRAGSSRRSLTARPGSFSWRYPQHPRRS